MKAILAAILALGMGSGVRAQGPVPGKVLRATGVADYPPVIWRDKQKPGRMTGLAIELLERAFQGLGIQVAGVYVGPWARAQAEVRAGQVDMLAGAYFTRERTAYLDYIDPPFFQNPTVVFLRKGDAFRFETWEDFAGLKGGAIIGHSFGEQFDRFAASNLDIERVPLLEQAFSKLLSGRSRYVLYGRYSGLAVAETLGLQDRLEFLPTPIVSEGLYFLVSRKSPFDTPEIKAHLAKKLTEFNRQKLPERLMEKYLKLWKEQNAP